MDPLEWSNLDEAAAWLAETTGEAWTAKHVLSAALRHAKSTHIPRTYLKAAMPRDTQFGLYLMDIEKGTPGNPFVRKHHMPWRTIPLHFAGIRDLLVHGETKVSIARSPSDEDGIENEHVFIEPLDQEHVVTVGMAGINRRDLLELAAKIKKSQATLLPDGPQPKPPQESGDMDHLFCAGHHGSEQQPVQQGKQSFAQKKSTPMQQDRQHCQDIARKLWEKNPEATKASLIRSDELAAYRNKYPGKNTLSDWLSKIDPRPKETRRGRPSKNTR